MKGKIMKKEELSMMEELKNKLFYKNPIKSKNYKIN